jgi:hypothetical protein
MVKDFIQYTEALELKQLGFNEPCLGYYLASTLFISNDNVYNSTDIPVIKAPLYSQAFRWFRENFNYHHTINLNKKYVGIAYSSVVNFNIDEFNTYEEAELACLKEMIKIVKTTR